MKFFTKNKVIAGVVGLIAVVSVVNTQAILSITNFVKAQSTTRIAFSGEGQEAQVFPTLDSLIKYSASYCLQVKKTENFNSVSPLFSVASNPTNLEIYFFFTLKNNCNYSIEVIRSDGGYNELALNQTVPTSFHKPIEIEVLSPYDTQPDPGTWRRFSGNGILPFPVEGMWNELIIPASNTSSIENDYPINTIRTITIPPHQEMDLKFHSFIPISDWVDLSPIRFSFKDFKWFKSSDYTNGLNLNINEIETLTIPDELKDIFTTSYVLAGSYNLGIIQTDPGTKRNNSIRR